MRSQLDSKHLFSFGFAIILFTKVATANVIFGGLFDGRSQYADVFTYTIEEINRSWELLPNSSVLANVDKTPEDDAVESSTKACDMLKSGITTLFSTGSGHTGSLLKDLSSKLHIPHLQSGPHDDDQSDDFTISLYPSPATLTTAYKQTLISLGWKTFYIIFNNNDGLIQAKELILDGTFNVKLIDVSDLSDYRRILQEVKQSGTTHIMLALENANLYRALKHAQEVGIMTPYYSYFITSLDLHTVPLDEFRHSDAFIFSLSLVMLDLTKIHQLSQDLGLTPPFKVSSKTSPATPPFISPLKRNRNYQPHSPLMTRHALLYDSVYLVAHALHELHNAVPLRSTTLNCHSRTPWPEGNSIYNYIKMSSYSGLTGLVKLNGRGDRTDVTLNVVQLQTDGLHKIAKWDITNGVKFFSEKPSFQKLVNRGIPMNLVVTTVVSTPYTMLRLSSDVETGNDRYEGFTIDLISEIAKILNFNITIKLSDDYKYGSYKNKTGEWDGMIGELINRKADLAIADLTITRRRESVIDFTMPWMNMGVSILYVKSGMESPSMFYFFQPFTLQVWICIMAFYCVTSIIYYILSRVTQNVQEINTTSHWSAIGHSFWYSVGSLFRHGTRPMPKAISVRILSLFWWFFTFLIICTYVVNLSGFRGVERSIKQIKSVDDLAKQTNIKYGTVFGGTTWNFFRNSKIDAYQLMYEFMESQQPSVYVKNNEEGWQRVLKTNGGYAFLMESSTIQYIVQRHCHLTQVGGLINARSYAIALPTGSPYLHLMNKAILELTESGKIKMLVDKWWKMRRGGGKCHVDTQNSDKQLSHEINFKDILGMIVILLIGVGLASIVAVVEFILNRRNKSRGGN